MKSKVATKMGGGLVFEIMKSMCNTWVNIRGENYLLISLVNKVDGWVAVPSIDEVCQTVFIPQIEVENIIRSEFVKY